MPLQRRLAEEKDQPSPELQPEMALTKHVVDHLEDEENSSLTKDDGDTRQQSSIGCGDISTAGPTGGTENSSFAFDIEALMRRRMLVQEDVAAEVSRPESEPAVTVQPEAQENSTLSSLFMGYGDEDSDNEEQPSLPEEETQVPVVVLKPKPMVVDPMLRSLVPASVLHKRPLDSEFHVAQKPRVDQRQSLSLHEVLEDDFNSFMSEIGNLPS